MGAREQLQSSKTPNTQEKEGEAFMPGIVQGGFGAIFFMVEKFSLKVSTFGGQDQRG